jgi:uncharacterized protein YdeI (YjbR/CyaY-like superfamily)
VQTGGVGKLDDLEWFQAETRDEWRAWLAENHATSPGVWLVTWKKSSGRPVLDYDEKVEEALAWGWIDTKGMSVDDERTRLVMCPRRSGSGWSRPNKERVARLEEQGLMQPAGRAVIAAAKADGSWTLLDDVEDLIVPPDLAEAFDRHPGSRAQWDGFAKSPRKIMLTWLVTAKRPETRATRVEKVAAEAAHGRHATG